MPVSTSQAFAKRTRAVVGAERQIGVICSRSADIERSGLASRDGFKQNIKIGPIAQLDCPSCRCPYRGSRIGIGFGVSALQVVPHRSLRKYNQIPLHKHFAFGPTFTHQRCIETAGF